MVLIIDGKNHNMITVPCTQEDCERCLNGKGGYQFRWIDPRWTPEAAIRLHAHPWQVQEWCKEPWPIGVHKCAMTDPTNIHSEIAPSAAVDFRGLPYQSGEETTVPPPERRLGTSFWKQANIILASGAPEGSVVYAKCNRKPAEDTSIASLLEEQGRHDDDVTTSAAQPSGPTKRALKERSKRARKRHDK